jgi:perosamine synthetase
VTTAGTVPARRLPRRRRPAPWWRVYPRHRLDLTSRHLGFALAACLFARGADDRERRIETETGQSEALVACTLRSGFDLLLEAAALPPGSEVLVSAVTHPDMARILERHGLVPVPVDIEPVTLAPRVDSLEAALTARTQALLVAHLFGARVDLDPAVRVAREHGLALLEDCAQSFRAPGDRGDPRADVSMFSFGSIKTNPALGGALLYVRRPDWLAGMRSLRAAWPRQPRREYLARTLRFAALHVLESPWVYGVFVRAAARLGRDADAFVNGAVHALKPPPADQTGAFDRWLHRRPSAALLALLAYRLRSFDGERLGRRAALGEELARALPPALLQPGSDAVERTHWVFPVVSEDPTALVATLREAGFDATRATTSITAIAPPAGSRFRPPTAATRLMDAVVFVPAYPELPPRARDALVAALRRSA